MYNTCYEEEMQEIVHLGKYKETVKLAQLCIMCSKINSHLFSLHVSESAACVCGHNVRDSRLITLPDLFLSLRI